MNNYPIHRSGCMLRSILFSVVPALICLGLVITFINLRNRNQQATAPSWVLPTTETTLETATTTPTTAPVFEPTNQTGDGLLPGLSIGDLHMHTQCSDGQNTYEEMVQEALDQGFTFIAITDHAWCPDILELCRNETKLLCIPGIELSGNNHIVALNLQDNINRLLPVPEQVRLIHEQGGLAIAAHPFMPTAEFSESDLLNSGFDAIECNVDGSGAITFDISSLRCVWDSDAHIVTALGLPYKYTVCDVLIRNFDELKAAILGGHCRPGQ